VLAEQDGVAAPKPGLMQTPPGMSTVPHFYVSAPEQMFNTVFIQTFTTTFSTAFSSAFHSAHATALREAKSVAMRHQLF
jgi:hypothetical protein